MPVEVTKATMDAVEQADAWQDWVSGMSPQAIESPDPKVVGSNPVPAAKRDALKCRFPKRSSPGFRSRIRDLCLLASGGAWASSAGGAGLFVIANGQ